MARDTAAQSAKLDASISGSLRKRTGASPGRSAGLGSSPVNSTTSVSPVRPVRGTAPPASARHFTGADAGQSSRVRAKPTGAGEVGSTVRFWTAPPSTGSRRVVLAASRSTSPT